MLVVLVRLTEHDLVVVAPKGVVEERHWVQVYVRVGPLRLTRARPVEVPYRQFCGKKRKITSPNLIRN